MRINFSKVLFYFLAFFSLKLVAQSTLPIYKDYLSDNLYLVHPAAAGVGNESKLRLTARQQWMDVPNAPNLQTLSFHSRLGEYGKSGFGFIFYNDENGYHSQTGFKGTYAYHLPLSEGRYFNQLSFALSFGLAQNQADQRAFIGDPAVAAIVESTGYFSSDFGMAYHYAGLSTYFTIKNLFLTAQDVLNVRQNVNLRNFIFSASYYYGEDYWMQFEPSVLVQFREGLGERIADVNLKVYKTFDKTQLWAAMSYRMNFDPASIENPTFISPIIGVNHKNWMFSYTYTNQINETVLTNTGFHQLSIGVNLWKQKFRAAASPNINRAFGYY